ncbi:MAG: hypothetical protein AB7V46_16280, partial [Thermomicrobiales bacterium]
MPLDPTGSALLFPNIAHSNGVARRPDFIQKKIKERFGDHRTVEIVNELSRGSRRQTLVRCEGRLYMVTWEEKTKPASDPAASDEPKLLAIYFPSSEPRRHLWSPLPIFLARQEKDSRPSQQAFSDELIEADQKLLRVFLVRTLGLETIREMAIRVQTEQGGRRFARIHIRAPLLGEKAPAFTGKFKPSPDAVVEWTRAQGGFDVLGIYGDRDRFGAFPQYKGELAAAAPPELVAQLEKALFGTEAAARQKEMVALERKLWQETQAELAAPPPKPAAARGSKKAGEPKAKRKPSSGAKRGRPAKRDASSLSPKDITQAPSERRHEISQKLKKQDAVTSTETATPHQHDQPPGHHPDQKPDHSPDQSDEARPDQLLVHSDQKPEQRPGQHKDETQPVRMVSDDKVQVETVGEEIVLPMFRP